MFINYYLNPNRSSPVNLAVARILVGSWVLWKMWSSYWRSVSMWPAFATKSTIPFLTPFQQNFELLAFEVVVTSLCLLGVIIGYRLAITGFLSAVTIGHLSAVHYMVTNSSTTFLPAIYLILLFAIYRSEDVISLDSIRKTKSWSLQELNSCLQSTQRTTTYKLSALKWALIVVSLIYFFTGYAKISQGFGWISGENIARAIVWESTARVNGFTPTTEFLFKHPTLLEIVAIGTVVLEIGLLAAVLFGFSLTLFAVGLLSMHTGIALTMQIFFFDQYILFAAFLPWDKLLARLESSTPLLIIYDEDCHFCARSLYLFKKLDLNDTVKFQPASDAPAEYVKRNDVDLSTAMYAIKDDVPYCGYAAFRHLIAHYSVFWPIVVLMGTAPIRCLGQRVYRVIAANRNRYFTCASE